MTQWARKIKKVQAKKLVKSNRIFREIAFLTVLNFFPSSKKSSLAIFELAKTGTSLSKEQAYVFKILDPIFSHSQEGKKIFYLNNKGNHYRDFTYIGDIVSACEKLISYKIK